MFQVKSYALVVLPQQGTNSKTTAGKMMFFHCNFLRQNHLLHTNFPSCSNVYIFARQTQIAKQINGTKKEGILIPSVLTSN
jgi:hypothetical protein